MTLTDIFKTNCRATAKLCGFNPSVAFSNLTSGIGGKNKNGTIARLSFEDFFIDLYFIENGPLAYAPNTIWLSVGLDVFPVLPFSVYDVLAHFDPQNFKCYTYSYVYTKEIMVETFGEINSFIEWFAPLMKEITSNGIMKNKLIASQKDRIKAFVGDDIFEKEIEFFDATARIRDMLLRNYVESIISHTVLGGVASFYNGNPKAAIKKLEKTKHKTLYEENLLLALKNGELKDYDPAPYRNELYKSYSKSARKATYSLGTGGFLKFIIPSLLMTPVTTFILGIVYLIVCAFKFNDTLYYLNPDVFSFMTLLLAGFLVAEIVSLNFSHKVKNPFKKAKKEAIKVKHKSRFLKYFTILTETLVIVLFFSAVNNTVSFTESRVYFPESTPVSLKQETLRYEYFETIYKARGYYLYNTKYVELEHYVLVAKNGEQIDLALYPVNEKMFEENVLPLFNEAGCAVTEVETERDIP